jgi:hypothetical protein
MPAVTLFRCTVLGAALALAACQRSPNDEQLAKLDNQTAGNQADPALTSALQDPILTDPALSQQSNKNAVRPADGPVQAQYPPGMGPAAHPARPGAPAAQPASAGHREMQRMASGEGTACGGPVEVDMGWARRLPAPFPVFPGARVTEAGGNDNGDCRFRVVTFTSDAAPERVLDWYRQRAAGAGYSAEHQRQQADHVLAGASARDGGAFYLIVTPAGRGSEVALIANKGV